MAREGQKHRVKETIPSSGSECRGGCHGKHNYRPQQNRRTFHAETNKYTTDGYRPVLMDSVVKGDAKSSEAQVQ
jgi:hypothetical protein